MYKTIGTLALTLLTTCYDSCSEQELTLGPEITRIQYPPKDHRTDHPPVEVTEYIKPLCPAYDLETDTKAAHYGDKLVPNYTNCPRAFGGDDGGDQPF